MSVSPVCPRCGEELVVRPGSAAQAWHDAIGSETPAVVVAVGPTTEGAARACGINVTHVAGEHSVRGLVDALVAALAR